MPLIGSFEQRTPMRTKVQETTRCEWFSFVDGGKTYLQLNTYGSENRKHKDIASQIIQLDEASAGHLKRLIEKTFQTDAT